MSYPIWHSCLRLSSVIFPVSCVWLFFTPHGTELTAFLALTAVASAGVWAFCSGHRQTPPEERQADEGKQVQAADLSLAKPQVAVTSTVTATPPHRARLLDLACEEDDLTGFDFALGSQLYQATQPSPAKESIPSAQPQRTSRASSPAAESHKD